MELSEEEKKSISQCKLLLEGEITLHIIGDDGGTDYSGKVNKAYNEDLKIVLNLIEKQQEEIEDLKSEKRRLIHENQELMIDLLDY